MTNDDMRKLQGLCPKVTGDWFMPFACQKVYMYFDVVDVLKM